VAQQFPTSAQVIYDVLASDDTFTDLLGTYSFRAGQTTTALSIVTAGADLPALRNVDGVECLIQDAGDITVKEYLTKDEPYTIVRWSVFLVAWGTATGADLQLAAEHICKRFTGATSIQTVATTDGLGSLVQTKVFIMSDKAIRQF